MSDSHLPMNYVYASSIDEATAAEGELRAGGTDLQERLRSGIASTHLIDIAGIQGLRDIVFSDTGVTIGALTTIAAVGCSKQLQDGYPALTLPAQTLATPQTRNAATMGGILCQRTRCHYYRHPTLGCPKKGNADTCPSRTGDHQFGVVYDFGPCVYPHPSTIGCALLTYDATLTINATHQIPIADLFGDGTDGRNDHTLASGQMITSIQLPLAKANEKAAYIRHTSREWAEWPLVEVVIRLIIDESTITSASIGIGGVANIPFRLFEVEKHLIGYNPNDASLSSAARLATTRCMPLPGTQYKVPMVEACVLEALEQAVADTETD